MTSLSKIRAVGIGDGLVCLSKKISYRLLAHRYRFDPWHAKSPFECRAYKREVVRLVNDLRPGVVVEVGCGLGEIISRIENCRRVGFDIDANVVEAARHLYGNRCEFAAASLADVGAVRGVVGDGGADVLIMVNWAHAMAWPELCMQIRALARAISTRYLVMDTIRAGLAGYAHHHSFDALAALGPIVTDFASTDEVRHLHVVELEMP